jgi:hypothetical protein
LITPFADAASQLESRVAALEARPPIPGPPGPPGAPGSCSGPGTVGRSPYLDIRDYGVQPDSGLEATDGFKKAMADTLRPGFPNEVFAPAGIYPVRELAYPGPGIGLVGQGKMGMSVKDCRATILQAIDNAGDSGPALAIDASQMSLFGWARGCSLRNIAVDVSLCRRFLGTTPPPVFAFYGVSNCGPFSDLVAYGNRGMAVDFASNYRDGPNGALTENVVLRDFFAYGGYLPGGGYADWMPAGPAIRIIGCDNITIEGGLLAYGCKTLPLPAGDILTDIPAILIAVDPKTGNATNNGVTIRGVAITNYVQSVRTKGALCPDGRWRWPQNLTLENMLVESFHDAFVFNPDPVPGGADNYFRSNINMIHNRIGGGNGWSFDGHQVIGDWMRGGRIELEFMGAPGGRMAGDVTLGPNARGVTVAYGPNPNGNAPTGIDVSGNNRFTAL